MGPSLYQVQKQRVGTDRGKRRIKTRKKESKMYSKIFVITICQLVKVKIQHPFVLGCKVIDQ